MRLDNHPNSNTGGDRKMTIKTDISLTPDDLLIICAKHGRAHIDRVDVIAMDAAETRRTRTDAIMCAEWGQTIADMVRARVRLRVDYQDGREALKSDCVY